jgi:hypothetical protein
MHGRRTLSQQNIHPVTDGLEVIGVTAVPDPALVIDLTAFRY